MAVEQPRQPRHRVVVDGWVSPYLSDETKPYRGDKQGRHVRPAPLAKFVPPDDGPSLGPVDRAKWAAKYAEIAAIRPDLPEIPVQTPVQNVITPPRAGAAPCKGIFRVFPGFSVTVREILRSTIASTKR